jgi:hypothetical protein
MMKKSIHHIKMPRPKPFPTAPMPSDAVIQKNVDYRAVKLRRLI